MHTHIHTKTLGLVHIQHLECSLHYTYCNYVTIQSSFAIPSLMVRDISRKAYMGVPINYPKISGNLVPVSYVVCGVM